MSAPVNNPRITQHFGKSVYKGFHRGTDYVSDSGDPRVFIPRIAPNGHVVKKGKHEIGGYYLITRHEWIDGRWFDLYFGHFKYLPDFVKNNLVSANLVLGEYGTSGQTYGAHVHEEVRIDVNRDDYFNLWSNGRLVDPVMFWENYRLVEKIRSLYPLLYKKLFNHDVKPENLQSFINAGEDFDNELNFIKIKLVEEKKCKF